MATDYEELKKIVKKANQRLFRLEQKYGTTSKWAGKYLEEKLTTEKVNAWTESNRIKLNKSMTPEQLKAVEKATERFLESFSTLTKIKAQLAKISQETKAGLKKKRGFTDSEAEFYSAFFENEDFTDLQSYIGYKELFSIIEYTVKNKLKQEQWLDEIGKYIQFGEDLDMKEKALNLYTSFM